ncbi:indolepyruvate/phenylpyruvate decarboxylase [Rugamonas apoptosis]|uniref:Indolepyruvate/phenylpyruvate decarboxylase n=1 Tax=Rugamonas apoptosis TaxID=2758570 RepID=A0A7W2F994_9BURK|nr:indolepyruvate/phenylpyruvate decarboxylase [Rugamonas apoptosis]MBA5687458.1 indolepyruvate/phenylpyruvate decarboxylase [Rugamonas apoptosis]
MNLSLSLLHALKAHGARELFGLPGDFVLPFFQQVEQSQVLPLYTLSHEPGVGFAADAAARFQGGGLGVAVVTYGAGALNMVNAVASSYAEKVPMVIISGAPAAHERRNGFLLHHQTRTLDSQLAIFREITCDQVVLNNAETAPADIARVLRNCQTQSRPVYIELPRDMVAVPCEPVPRLPAPARDVEALQACVQELLARLAQARNPVLLVGIEIRRFGVEEKVARLAKLLRVPVATTIMGRGLLADTDAPLMGTYLGVAGDPAITQAVEESDALLMLGVLVSDTNFGVSERKIDMRRGILALDGQVSMGYHVYPDISLEALLDGLLASAQSLAPQAPEHKMARYPHELQADGERIEPMDIARAVNDLMASHGRMPIVSDIGDCFFTALDIENTALLAPGYYATMGYGVPAGLGLQASSGERPIILVGDGAFQMTGWELGNCQRYGWDPIVIVFNNCGWEMLRTFQPTARYNDLSDWHFADAVPALGGDGYRAETREQLQQALQKALATRGKFQLIEAMLPRGALSATLARFVDGVRRLQSATPAA